MTVDDRARRQAEKALLRASEALTRVSILEKAFRALSTAQNSPERYAGPPSGSETDGSD